MGTSASCPALNITSQGQTVEDARTNLVVGSEDLDTAIDGGPCRPQRVALCCVPFVLFWPRLTRPFLLAGDQMQETSTQSEQIPILLPPPSKRISAIADAPAPPPLRSELHRFLDLVVCDGRYLGEVLENPRLVAEKLNFDLSAETETEFRAKPLEQHLADLYVDKFQMARANPIAIIVIAAIIIIIAIVVVRYTRTEAVVRDLSPQAKLKL